MGVGLVGLRLARRTTGGGLEPARAVIGGRIGLDISSIQYMYMIVYSIQYVMVIALVVVKVKVRPGGDGGRRFCRDSPVAERGGHVLTSTQVAGSTLSDSTEYFLNAAMKPFI